MAKEKVTVWVEFDKDNKKLKNKIYHFKPDIENVVEITIKEGELIDLDKYTVKEEKGSYKAIKKK